MDCFQKVYTEEKNCLLGGLPGGLEATEEARTWVGPHIYFIVWTFQIGRAAASTEKGKIHLFKTSVVCWTEQDVEDLLTFVILSIFFLNKRDTKLYHFSLYSFYSNVSLFLLFLSQLILGMLAHTKVKIKIIG